MSRLALVLVVACSSGNAPVIKPSPVVPPPPPDPPGDRTPPGLRLSTRMAPSRAAVEMWIDPAADQARGVIDFDVDFVDAGKVLWLHALDLTVSRATLTASGETMTLEPFTAPDLLGLEAPHMIPSGTGKLHVEYVAHVTTKEHSGLFRQQDNGNWYLFTKFESTDARRAFPCFDEPSFKFPWQVTLHVPDATVAVSNTPIAKETSDGNGGKVVRFDETKPLPSYLVAFAVGPFETVDAPGAGIPMRIVVPAGHAAEAKVAAANAPELVRLLARYFDMPYPYAKLDLVAVPAYPGAMENAAMIIFGMDEIVHADADWTPQAWRGFANVVAHEIAHMWFGDLVTTGWWDDIWLNEAFATWMAAKIVDEWKPLWRGAITAVDERGKAMDADALVTARKIRQRIDKKTDIQAAFDGITYQKGASILRMFEAALGPEVFRKGVHEFLVKHAWGNATASDFLDALDQASGKDVSAQFSTFLDQAGLPLVTVELACEKGKPPAVTFAQERYLPPGSKAEPQRWQLPVCMRWPGGRTCTTISEATATVPLDAKTCPAWLSPNDGAIGYYRVKPKGELFAKMLAAPASAVPATERIAIADDAVALVFANLLEPGDALRLLPAIAADPDPRVAVAAAGMLAQLDELVPDDARASYRRLIAKLLGPRARALGWLPRHGENDDTQSLRLGVLSEVAGEAGDPALVAKARELVTRHFEHHDVPHEVASEAMVTAAIHGDAALFDRLHAAYGKTADREERYRIVAALGLLGDPAAHDQALALILGDELDGLATLRLLFASSGNRPRRAATLAFVQAHYDAVIGKLSRRVSTYLPNIARGFCDDARRAEVEQFFRPRVASIMGGDHVLDEVLERIRACTAVRTANEKGLRAFLARS